MTTTPELLPQRDSVPQPSSWDSLQTVLEAHYHDPDIEAARALYAAVAAHRLADQQPVWVMAVAPPGSAKTDLLESLDGLPSVHLVDRITPNAFLSGQVGRSRAPASLLHRIGESGVLICPDFSTLLSMNRNHRGAVLSDLRRIYDGHLRRELGTAERLDEREWRGRLTMLVGATPDAVDRHYTVFQGLGERFVMLRYSRPEGTAAALRAMGQDRQRVKEELRNAVAALFDSLPNLEPVLPESLQRRIAALAEFVALARTHVPRDGKSKSILYVPEAEGSTRLAQQLCQLAKGAALLEGRETVNEVDLRLAQRVGFDSITATKRRIFATLIAGKRASPSNVGLPQSTYSYAVEDLMCFDLLKTNWDEDERYSFRLLSDKARRLLRQAGVRVKRRRCVKGDLGLVRASEH